MPYVRLLADLLHLKDWSFTVMTEGPEGESAIAAINCAEGRKYAHVRLSDNFLCSDPESQRQTLIHELLHCHLAAADHVAGKMIKENFDLFRLHCEYGVDGIADAIAPLLPLPTWS
jgi:hypothetical protein